MGGHGGDSVSGRGGDGGIANKAPVEMVGMEATVLEEAEKEDLVELDLKGMARMKTMETRDNQGKRM
jgi:hypothetical protein